MAESTPYSTARQLLGAALPDWLKQDDAERLGSYQLYEDIYWSQPEIFKLIMRGTDDLPPIYLPSARIIINTMRRYVARGWGWAMDPAFGSANEQAAAKQIYDDLFARENMLAQFSSNKLYGLIRGDACWYVTADASKPEGQRISVKTLDPRAYFPILDADGNRTGVDLIERKVNVEDGAVSIKRQRYLKPGHEQHPGGEFISYQIDTFELEGWQGPTPKKTVGGDSLPVELIQGITRLPVYHVKNFEEPNNPWGCSETRGIERLLAAINQTVSDTDLALALAGLGVYTSDGGAPVDEEGNDIGWNIGPGEVVETGAGKKFDRVDGINSVDAPIKHVEFLQDQAYRVSGASDVAQGRVEVKTAESGIALKLRMGPILDEAAEKDLLLMGKMNNLLFDLREWIRVFEGENLDNVRIISTLGPKLPENVKETFDMLMAGLNCVVPLWSTGYVRDELRKRGWDIPMDMLAQIAAEQMLLADAADPYSSRVDGEEDEEVEE